MKQTAALNFSPFALLLVSLFAVAAPLKLHAQAATSSSSVLETWRKNLSAAHTQPVNIVVIGDSIACCFGPADYGNIWTNVLRKQESLRYQAHSTGIIPVGNDNGLSTNPQWSRHPHSGSISTISYGPFQSGVGAFGTVFRLQGNAELTVLLPVKPPTGIVLYYTSATDTADGISIHYDNRPPVAIKTAQSATLQAQRVSLPLAEARSSTLTISASGHGSACIYGIEFVKASTGVTLHNLAHGYARSEAWGRKPEEQLAFLSQIQGGIQLAILSLGVNDSINGTGTTQTEYRANLTSIIVYLRKLDTHMPIVIFDEVSTRTGESSAPLPQDLIRLTEKSVAEEFGVGYISPLAAFGSFASADEQGLFAPDKVHPSDLGNRRIANVLGNYLESASADRPQ